jgi:hypothetical protein
LREEHIVGGLALRVPLVDSALEVLNAIDPTVELAMLKELVRDREALVREAAMGLPVREKGAAQFPAGLGEVDRACASVRNLAGCSNRIRLLISERTEQGQLDIVGWTILGMVLEKGAFEVLDGVEEAIEGGNLAHFIGDRIAELS